jgi:hypothetical protein
VQMPIKHSTDPGSYISHWHADWQKLGNAPEGWIAVSL